MYPKLVFPIISTFFNTCFWPRELTLTAADWIYFEQKQFHELSHSEKLPNFDQLNNKRLNFLFQTCSPLIFIAWLFVNIEFNLSGSCLEAQEVEKSNAKS